MKYLTLLLLVLLGAPQQALSYYGAGTPPQIETNGDKKKKQVRKKSRSDAIGSRLQKQELKNSTKLSWAGFSFFVLGLIFSLWGQFSNPTSIPLLVVGIVFLVIALAFYIVSWVLSIKEKKEDN